MSVFGVFFIEISVLFPGNTGQQPATIAHQKVMEFRYFSRATPGNTRQHRATLANIKKTMGFRCFSRATPGNTGQQYPIIANIKKNDEISVLFLGNTNKYQVHARQHQATPGNTRQHQATLGNTGQHLSSLQ